jgi:hypothetical protein
MKLSEYTGDESEILAALVIKPIRMKTLLAELV